MRRSLLVAAAVCGLSWFAASANAEDHNPFQLLGTAKVVVDDASSAGATSVPVTPVRHGCGYGGYGGYYGGYSAYRPYYGGYGSYYIPYYGGYYPYGGGYGGYYGGYGGYARPGYGIGVGFY